MRKRPAGASQRPPDRADRRRITIFPPRTGRDVVADVVASGALAVVFCEPA
jgi:hypothetical protein